MADNFDLMATALKAVCPNNEILLDNAGKPSVMVRIPKMTYAQLGMGESTALFPAFIINGQEVDEIYISKYLNIVQNGRAYSLPGVDPAANMNFDQARSYCEAKGDGWHCMTRMEWGLLMRICEMQGFIPLGNNNAGTVMQQGTPQDAAHFTNQEDGIWELFACYGLLLNYARQMGWDVERGSINLTNTAKPYPFNNSQKTVALQMQRPSRDYIVITEASNVKGNLGQIEVSDQLSNGFKVAYTGSATAATINYIVIGGYMK